MPHITYAYLGPDSEAAKFAKKGTATDITLYNAKQGDVHLNLVHANRFPEKLTSLLAALDLADEIVAHPQELDRAFGETVVGAELFGKTHGWLRLGPQVDAAGVQTLLAKTGLRDLELSTDPDGRFRERLCEHAAPAVPGPTIVPVDHAFPVKGVGTVVLGLVRSGEVATHQELRAYPGDRLLDVRSVQVHDVDQARAVTGSRVGLALKGVEASELPRGTVLAPPGSLRVVPPHSPVELRMELTPFARWEPRAGAVLHLYHVLQDVVLRVENVMETAKTRLRLTATPEAPLALVTGQPAVAVDLDQKAQRFVGRVEFAP